MTRTYVNATHTSIRRIITNCYSGANHERRHRWLGRRKRARNRRAVLLRAVDRQGWLVMSEPRQIAVVRSYDELVLALRARAFELGATHDSIDEVAGLPMRYTSKAF